MLCQVCCTIPGRWGMRHAAGSALLAALYRRQNAGQQAPARVSIGEVQQVQLPWRCKLPATCATPTRIGPGVALHGRQLQRPQVGSLCRHTGRQQGCCAVRALCSLEHLEHGQQHLHRLWESNMSPDRSQWCRLAVQADVQLLLAICWRRTDHGLHDLLFLEAAVWRTSVSGSAPAACMLRKTSVACSTRCPLQQCSSRRAYVSGGASVPCAHCAVLDW